MVAGNLIVSTKTILHMWVFACKMKIMALVHVDEIIHLLFTYKLRACGCECVCICVYACMP